MHSKSHFFVWENASAPVPESLQRGAGTPKAEASLARLLVLSPPLIPLPPSFLLSPPQVRSPPFNGGHQLGWEKREGGQFGLYSKAKKRKSPQGLYYFY